MEEKGMQIKTIAMMMAAGCAVAMLTGCGVPQEDFDAKVAELATAGAEIEALNVKLADKESLLDAERSKSSNANAKLAAANKSNVALKTKEAQTASSLVDEKAKVARLETDVASAQSATASAREQTREVETELDELQEDYQTLQNRFDQFEKNMKALDTPRVVAPAVAAPVASETKSALDVLNDMSVQ